MVKAVGKILTSTKLIPFTVLFFVFVLIGAAFILPNIKFQNSRWFDKNSETEKLEKRILETFLSSNEELAVLVLLDKSFVNKVDIDNIKTIENKLINIDGVKSIKSPLSAKHFTKQKGLNSIKSESFLSSFESSGSSYDFLSKLLLQSDYNKVLYSEDLRNFVFSIKFEYNRDGKLRANIIQNVKDVLDSSAYKLNYEFVGNSYLKHSINVESASNTVFLCIIAFVLTVFGLLLIYKCIYRVFIIFVTAVFAVGTVLISSFFLVDSLSALSAVIFVMIIIISVSDSIHILNNWEHSSGLDHKTRIYKTISLSLLPCFLTSFTTAIGFGSFYFTNLVPIKDLGIYSFIGIIVTYLITVISNFAMLNLFGHKIVLKDEALDSKFGFSNIIAKYSKFVEKITFSKRSFAITLVINVLLIVVTPVFFASLKTDSSLLNGFYWNDSKIQQTFKKFDDNFHGTMNFDVVIDLASRQNGNQEDEELSPFQKMENLKLITSISDTILQTITEVKDIKSYLVPVKNVQNAFSDGKTLVPDGQEQLSQDFLILEFSKDSSGGDVMSEYLSFDYKTARLVLRTKNLPSQEQEKIVKSINNILLKSGLEKDQFSVGGFAAYYAKVGSQIIVSQILSISVTVVIIFGIFWYFFSFKKALIGTFVNIMPAFLTVIFMSLIKSPMDFSTIVVYSVAFSVCVDNTIHWLFLFLTNKHISKHAVQDVIRHTTKPFIYSATFCIIVFCVFLVSDLKFLDKFGIYSSFMILTAVVYDTLILPIFAKKLLEK